MGFPQPLTRKARVKKQPKDEQAVEGEYVRAIPKFEPRLLYIPTSHEKRPRTKNGNARPFVPTDWQRGMVAMAKACGLSDTMIASNIVNPDTGLAISIDTLSKHFHQELSNGAGKIEFNLAAKLYHSAIYLDDTRANMFLLKTRFGWKEDAAPVLAPGDARAALVVPGVMTIEDWERLSAEHRTTTEQRAKELVDHGME